MIRSLRGSAQRYAETARRPDDAFWPTALRVKVDAGTERPDHVGARCVLHTDLLSTVVREAESLSARSIPVKENEIRISTEDSMFNDQVVIVTGAGQGIG